ncbi:MAG: tocopherol cyclase family protein [Cyanobacteria bacterium J06643_4]
MTSGTTPELTPHGGYHWRGQSTRFFEGWYFRLTLPEIAQSFAFMYSIDDPAGGQPHSGGAAQILGPDEAYCCRTFPEVGKFWARSHTLAFGHHRTASLKKAGPCPPQDFTQTVTEGYQIQDHHHQGRLLTPAGDVQAEWDFTITPQVSWGQPTAKSTAGWLSYLPVFEPGWQVLMAHGHAAGWIIWQGTHYTFDHAPAYAEKNWGGAFPSKWFWLQCNAFPSAPDLSITAVGGIRDVLTWQEDVGLIGIHYQGRFYEFFSRKNAFTWQVDPWGYWQLTANDYRYRVQITGKANDEGALVRVPTHDGLQWLCRDTTHGNLRVQLWAASDHRLIFDAVSDLAGLEVGGGLWEKSWLFESYPKRNNLL